jgi:phosphoribosyl 1,2-cyclic phosphodiesterase
MLETKLNRFGLDGNRSRRSNHILSCRRSNSCDTVALKGGGCLRFSVLASGSSGNLTVIECNNRYWLLDVGLSCKRAEEKLFKQGVDPSKVEGIFVTHEHVDHYRGIAVFSKKYNAKVYANRNTWRALERLKVEVPESLQHEFSTGTSLEIGELLVTSFSVSHDAAEPVGYTFSDGQVKLGIATDLGYFSPVVAQAVAGSDVLVLEANHDVEMLRMGRYPWNIKRRILSDEGHLSNVAAGEALAELNHPKLQRVYLAHLSKEHNMQELARLTVHQTLEEMGVRYGFRIMDTYDDQATDWDDVRTVELVAV